VGEVGGPRYIRDQHWCVPDETRATVVITDNKTCRLAGGFKAHTGFEPVLPPNAEGKPDSCSRGRVASGSELNPHLRAILDRLKERDRERRR
jgi:hypothetical protein